MATVLSASEVSLYFPAITASVGTIVSRKLIESVEQRLTLMTNNYFTLDLHVQDSVTFNATANSITLNNTTSYAQYGIRAGHNIYIYNSYENDKFCTIASVTSNVATIASAYSVVDELSGRSVLISVVKWPEDIKMIAAEMVYFDSDIRGKTAPNIKSRSLGPLSESFTTGSSNSFGYPDDIVNKLEKYSVARFC